MSNPVKKSPQIAVNESVMRIAHFDDLTTRVLRRHNAAFHRGTLVAGPLDS
jgi:hypothetical protein